MVTVVVGTQWGDEGKGKIIDYLAGSADIVARYQGGANAGHTVVFNGRKFVFHLLPSGVLREGKVNVIGNGVVVDPVALFQEIEQIEQAGVRVAGRLLIAENAHLTLPYHKALDTIEDKHRGKGKLGTTGRGIGTTYVDKFNRIGIRVVDFLDERLFREKVAIALELKNYLFKEYYGEKKLSVNKIVDEYGQYREKMRPFVANTCRFLNDAVDAGKHLLAEGAQGTFLDIDWGTYPYVTASSSTAGGACTGLGISPRKISRVVGVAKAYTTRVGMGPFPTESHDEIGQRLRTAGNEFGATTGRPRRCGWFDACLVRFACRVNGIDELVITKLDVLSGHRKVKIGVGYTYGGRTYDEFPLDAAVFTGCEVVYEEMPGWEESLSGVRRYEDLPAQARRYVDRLEELARTRISMVSVGSDREQTFRREG